MYAIRSYYELIPLEFLLTNVNPVNSCYLISFFIKRIYERRKQTAAIASKPTNCGHTSIKLCPAGSGPGIAP